MILPSSLWRTSTGVFPFTPVSFFVMPATDDSASLKAGAVESIAENLFEAR